MFNFLSFDICFNILLDQAWHLKDEKCYYKIHLRCTSNQQNQNDKELFSDFLNRATLFINFIRSGHYILMGCTEV